MTTPYDQSQAEQSAYNQSQPAPPSYEQPQAAQPQAGQPQAEPSPVGSPAGPGSGLSTDQLAGAGSAGGQSTQEFAEVQPADSQSTPDTNLSTTPLFAEDERESITDRWTRIQSAFVDEPREAVQQADELVAELMQHLARIFADERGQLEAQWSSGTDVSTEDLRLGLQRYREFFHRLLAA